MKRVISFSLWGDNEVYLKGAIENIKLAKELFPDWECWFYVSTQNTPSSVIEKIREYDNAKAIEVDEVGAPLSMLHRFLPCDNDDVERFISRDTDSRLSMREKAAVDEWIESDQVVHIMRDHPYHTATMMGGMWGMRKNDLLPKSMHYLTDNFRHEYTQNQKGMDQFFLGQYVFPYVNNDACVHDPFYSNRPFPTERPSQDEVVYYVGECVRADNTLWSQSDRDILFKWEFNRRKQ